MREVNKESVFGRRIGAEINASKAFVCEFVMVKFLEVSLCGTAEDTNFGDVGASTNKELIWCDGRN